MRWLLALGLASLLPLSATAHAAPASGKLRVVTYNVAGLPEGISASRPATNSPLIGERLNRYDLVLVQEDFAYGRELRARVRLPYQSGAFVRGERYDFGDGLSVFSRFPFAELERTAWTACHGITGDYFDCLTPKGFTVTTLTLGDGVVLDVYDAHLDAGSSDGDRAARTAQLEQLAAAIILHSEDRAVLLGGDFNLDANERTKLERFERATGLADACSALRCPHEARVDRVLFRASGRVELSPLHWRIAPGFLDTRGVPLSDHAPVAVDFHWRRRDVTPPREVRLSSSRGGADRRPDTRRSPARTPGYW
jgi:endonuclease/exonuclease/phosphatase family metal-dependent hydrolase